MNQVDRLIELDRKYRYRDKGVPPLFRVLCVDKPGDYPVVTCDAKGGIHTNKISGQEHENCLGLYDLIEVSPYEDIPIDAKVLVRSGGLGNWHRRYFAGVSDSGKPMAWVEGTTSWSTVLGSIPWYELKLPEE